MGKGLLAGRQRQGARLGGLQSGDYEMAGFDDADVVLAIGYDLVEHSPEHWNPKRDKKIICIDSVASGDGRLLHPEVELSATSTTSSPRSARSAGTCPTGAGRQAARRRARPLRAGEGRRRLPASRRARCGRSARRWPRRHPDLGRGPAQALDRPDVPGVRPNTVLIANGLAGMGFAVPAAVAAKLVHPDRKVVTVNGDGGFLMNCQGSRPPCGSARRS